MSSPPEALLAAVDREPDSLEARRVLGDWLSENDDPRGELIALQTKELRVTDPLLNAGRRLSTYHVATHADALWGPLVAAARPLVRWRLGYWDQLVLTQEQTDLDAVLSHPSARFLRKLWVQGHRTFAGPPLPQLELLEVDFNGTWVIPALDEAPLPKALRLNCSDLELPPDVLPLRQLRIGRPSVYTSVDGEPFASLRDARWPALEVLELQVPASIETIIAMVDRARCPKLRSLSLQLEQGQGAQLNRRLVPLELDEVFIELNLAGVVFTEIRTLIPWVERSRQVKITNLEGRGYEGPGNELADFLV